LLIGWLSRLVRLDLILENLFFIVPNMLMVSPFNQQSPPWQGGVGEVGLDHVFQFHTGACSIANSLQPSVYRPDLPIDIPAAIA
jgi:hypothetical protein